MRVWITQLSLADTLKDLDDQRLLAQHREAVGMLSMAAGPKRDMFVNNPLRKAFEAHQAYLIQVHDLAVEELGLRGFECGKNHQTPIVMASYPFYDPGTPFVPTEDQIAFDRADLCNRYILHSKDVLEGRRTARMDYIRWTARPLPEWLTLKALEAIEREHEFFKKRLGG